MSHQPNATTDSGGKSSPQPYVMFIAVGVFIASLVLVPGALFALIAIGIAVVVIPYVFMGGCSIIDALCGGGEDPPVPEMPVDLDEYYKFEWQVAASGRVYDEETILYLVETAHPEFAQFLPEGARRPKTTRWGQAPKQMRTPGATPPPVPININQSTP